MRELLITTSILHYKIYNLWYSFLIQIQEKNKNEHCILQVCKKLAILK